MLLERNFKSTDLYWLFYDVQPLGQASDSWEEESSTCVKSPCDEN